MGPSGRWEGVFGRFFARSSAAAQGKPARLRDAAVPNASDGQGGSLSSKVAAGVGHPPGATMHAMASSPTLDAPVRATTEARPSLGTAAEVYERHADFVWASLARLGVARDDLPDQLQEVFLVVHRRLDSYDGSCAVTTWLFGICLRAASDHRRRAWRRREHVGDAPVEEQPGSTAATPEDDVSGRQARAQLDEILDELDIDKRAVFVMFEIDEMSCDEIADVQGIPVGTIYSRLSAARKEFQKAIARMHARDAYAPRSTR